MRSVLVALLVTSAALLAGCSDDGGHEHESYTCPDGTELNLEDFPDHDNATFNPLAHCGGSSNGTNSTAAKPNVLPVLVLTSTDDGGNVTNVTLLEGNLTFSAEGSTDSDGSITGIAVSVTDSNTTRTATLYDPTAKAFKSATFKFDRPGIVNVTVAMVDDRAGFTVSQSKVYVNHLQVSSEQNIALPDGSPVGSECDIGDDIIGAQFYKEPSFSVMNGATMIEALLAARPEVDGAPASAVGTICGPGPESEVLSDTSDHPVAATGPYPAALGTESYKVGITTEVPSARTFVTATVLVHYEPNPVAQLAPAA